MHWIIHTILLALLVLATVQRASPPPPPQHYCHGLPECNLPAPRQP